jgi:hypothetical protein
MSCIGPTVRIDYVKGVMDLDRVSIGAERIDPDCACISFAIKLAHRTEASTTVGKYAKHTNSTVGTVKPMKPSPISVVRSWDGTTSCNP